MILVLECKEGYCRTGRGVVEGQRRSNRLGTPIHPLWAWVGCVDLPLHHPAIWLLVASNLIGETETNEAGSGKTNDDA